MVPWKILSTWLHSEHFITRNTLRILVLCIDRIYHFVCIFAYFFALQNVNNSYLSYSQFQVVFVMIVSLFFASLILVPSILAKCPEGWWRAGDACYMVSHSRMTWYRAQEVQHMRESVHISLVLSSAGVLEDTWRR